MPRVWETKRLWDKERVAALRDFEKGAIDKHLTARLNFLCITACELTKSPASLITLVDGDWEFRLASHGLPGAGAGSQTETKNSICATVVDRGAPLVLNDTAADPIFCDHAGVTEFGIQSYLGSPLYGIHKFILGSFCVIDYVPRDWSYLNKATMKDLSTQATGLILA